MKYNEFKQIADPVDVYLGAQVRAHRRRLGLSVGDLAARIAVTPGTIVTYEAGTRRMPLGKLMAVAAALRMTPAHLYADIALQVPPAALARHIAYLDRLYARAMRRFRGALSGTTQFMM